MIVHGLGPAWYRWSFGDQAFVDELVYLRKKPGLHVHSSRRAEACVVWLLDRLMSPAEVNPFREFMEQSNSLAARACALYAWGRRVEDVEGLFTASFDCRSPTWAAALAAWCEGCRDSTAETVLRWWETCERFGLQLTGTTDALPVHEFSNRVTDPQERWPRLLDFVRGSVAKVARKYPSTPLSEIPYRKAIQEAIRYVVCDIAPTFPPPEKSIGELHNIVDWFYGSLVDGKFTEVRDICRELCTEERALVSAEELALCFWVERFGDSKWEEFRVQVRMLEDAIPLLGISRFARICPRDRIDAWDLILAIESRTNHAMREFCGWLLPEYCDVLRRFFDDAQDEEETDVEDDRPACAFHAYLHKAPRAVLRQFWEYDYRKRMPNWQQRTLDRFLHAPTSIRPQPVVYDVRDVENDMRLLDPLNRRRL